MAAQENVDGTLGYLQDIFSSKEGLRRVVETFVGMPRILSSFLSSRRLGVSAFTQLLLK